MTEVEKAERELQEAYKGDDWDWIQCCQIQLLIAQRKEREKYG